MIADLITVEYWPHTGTWRILVAGVPVGYWPTEDEAEMRARQARRALVDQDTTKRFDVPELGAQLALDPFCAVPDCGLPRTGRSPYCKKHHMRWRRHGDPTITLMPRRSERTAPREAEPIDDLTIGQAAKVCSISERRIQDLIYAGKFAARKVSGVWLIERASVEVYAATPRRAGRPRKEKAHA